MPRLYVSPTPQPNAFATGRNPAHAAVCVTEGIIAMLTPRELRGVIGHELSHVYNRDILISSVAGALASFITMLAQFAFFFGGVGDDEDGPGIVGALMMLILGSDGRDADPARDQPQPGVPGGRVRCRRSPTTRWRWPVALRKIDGGTRAMPLSPDGPIATTSHLMIANPFRTRGMANLFATHPPMAERIARLETMAAQHRPGPVPALIPIPQTKPRKPTAPIMKLVGGSTACRTR